MSRLYYEKPKDIELKTLNYTISQIKEVREIAKNISSGNTPPDKITLIDLFLRYCTIDGYVSFMKKYESPGDENYFSEVLTFRSLKKGSRLGVPATSAGQ